MKLRFFGTCAGTEPISGWHHCSFAVERDDGTLYWFDAGECCSYTAYVTGTDLMALRAVFISHTHMDHVGGLGNLFWNLNKISRAKNRPMRSPEIDLYIPVRETWDGLQMLLRHTEGGFKTEFEIVAHDVQDGVIFDEGGVRVTALTNHHLKSGNSFSYRLDMDGKSIVYSGDVGGPEDVFHLCAGGCDALLIETGHHDPEKVCDILMDGGVKAKLLCYTHNGAALRKDPDGMEKKLTEQYHGPVCVARDGLVVEL